MKKIKKVILSLIYKIFNKKPKVMSADETIDYIYKNQVNIGRFGDGELALMLDKSIGFQEKNDLLKKKLTNVKTDKKFLTCIPNIFNNLYFNKKIIVHDEYKYWTINKKSNLYLWHKFFSDNSLLGDAFITRFYLRYKDKSFVEDYIRKLKQLWNEKNILIVEGYTSQVGVGNDFLNNAKSVRRILCPNKNAFNYYDEILDAIKKYHNSNDLVLLALGPTATVLSYDLSKENIWALDLGHFDIEYEWFLAKTDKKISVKNKHVNECGSIGCINNDSEFKKQVVLSIKED